METNLIETDFSDVTFNLAEKVKIFWKTENTPIYINIFSILPPANVKQLPEMIKKRITDLSCINFRSKPNWPQNSECLIQCLVYKTMSRSSNNNFGNYWDFEWEFKTQYNNHSKSFRHCECMSDTELSKHM